MTILFRNILLGIFTFLLFSQMSSKRNEYVRLYKNSEPMGYMTLKLKNNNTYVQKIRGCYRLNIRGEWKLEDEQILLLFKNRLGEFSSDTLKIKRLDSKIDSLGNYKKH